MTRGIVMLVGLVGACAVVGDDKDKDPVREKLFAAKVAYDKEITQYRTQAGNWFDKREDAARKDGNKKLVDQIKAERKAFDEEGELPKSVPATIKQKQAAAKKALEASYEQAVKEYVKAKKDDEAAAVEKELGKLREGSLAVTPADPFQPKSTWVNDKPKMTLTVIERKGNTFRARFVAGDTIEREVRGTIKDGKVSWLAKDVRALKGGPGHDNHGTFDKEGEKIDFTFGFGNNPPAGTYTMHLVKDK
jgi:hypothetical protein